MDGPAASELTPPLSQLRQDLARIVRAAIDAVDAGLLVRQTLAAPGLAGELRAAANVDVIAAGKAASAMLDAFVESGLPARSLLAIGPSRPDALPAGAEWREGGHPLPTEGSVRGAQRALEVASSARADDVVLVLLSGGGSSLMALPAEGVTLDQKQRTVRLLLEGGADIYELNTVRKHLSAIKGGLLAAASPGRVITLAVSDVVGDDLSVIASGPTVPDSSTYADALAVLARRGGLRLYPAPVVARLEAGVAGAVPETPHAGDERLSRAYATVIGPQRGAVDGAVRAAMLLGYATHVVAEPVTGEARLAAAPHIEHVARVAAGMARPACIISAGETTVTVTGHGKGGRNQEFAFAAAQSIGRLGDRAAAASAGTDGIDGPTDAAGAVVDPTTLARARAAGVGDPDAYLRDNNTYAFFDRIGDLIRTGPTRTNVGDIQVVLVG